MKPWFESHLKRPFLRTLAEVSWFGPVVSAVLVALLVNMTTEALTQWGGLPLGFLALGGLALTTIAFVYIYDLVDSRRRSRSLGTPADREHPSKYEGLVFLFSREDTLREAIQYHQPELKYCWLVVTPQMQTAASQLVAHFPAIQFSLEPVNDLYDTRACYEIACNIFGQKAELLRIPVRRIVADITGGTKPMTVGLLLACIRHQITIQHVPTAYDSTGKPQGPLPPIVIEVMDGR